LASLVSDSAALSMNSIAAVPSLVPPAATAAADDDVDGVVVMLADAGGTSVGVLDVRAAMAAAAAAVCASVLFGDASL
jgi:hypothetical protein